MPRTSLAGPLAALLLTGCGGTAIAALRVRPPPLEPGDTAEAQETRVVEAVRDVGALGRLECAPPRVGGGLLDCWPATAAEAPVWLSLHLHRDPGAWRVSVFESYPPFSAPRLLCPIQDRLSERLEFRLGGGAVERDPRVDCPRKRP